MIPNYRNHLYSTLLNGDLGLAELYIWWQKIETWPQNERWTVVECQEFWNKNDNHKKYLVEMDQGRFQKERFGSCSMRLILIIRKIWFYSKKCDGTLETSKLPKKHSEMVKKVDPLIKNWQIIDTTLKDLRYPAIEIRKLFSYCKKIEPSGNWIKMKD